MSTTRQAPPSVRSLITRIENVARDRDRPVRRIQRAIANTVVGQMLPPGVVKGGTAMKVRVGEGSSRFTPDLDASRIRALSLDEYLAQLDDRLLQGGPASRARGPSFPHPRPPACPTTTSCSRSTSTSTTGAGVG